ncbi:MAG: hypothetical protein AB8I08_06085 [Sandaracinaceae bacterium]
MLLRERIELPAGEVIVENHETFLLIQESGTLRHRQDLEHYTQHLERVMRETGVRKAVIDARAEQDNADQELRDLMWAWMTHPTLGFETVALVLPSEMAVARVNMTSLARGANIRAFDNLFAAQRWLIRGRRRSTSTFRSSSPPPPPDGSIVESGERRRHSSLPPEGASRSSNAPASSSFRPPGAPTAAKDGERVRPTRHRSEPRRRGALTKDDDSEGVA